MLFRLFFFATTNELFALCFPLELQDAVGEVLVSLRDRRVTVLLMARDCDVSGMESFSTEVEQASDAPLPRSLRSGVTFKSPAVLIYTSGTTGVNLRRTSRATSLTPL